MRGLLPETAEAKRKGCAWKTWRFDAESGEAGGWIDGTEALRQAAVLRLMVPRYRHLIYSFQYGSELENLIGKDGKYAEAAAPALAEEALLRDGRFREVRDAAAVREGDGLRVFFTAVTDWGSFQGAVPLKREEGSDEGPAL